MLCCFAPTLHQLACVQTREETLSTLQKFISLKCGRMAQCDSQTGDKFDVEVLDASASDLCCFDLDFLC